MVLRHVKLINVRLKINNKIERRFTDSSCLIERDTSTILDSPRQDSNNYAALFSALDALLSKQHYAPFWGLNQVMIRCSCCSTNIQ